MQGECYPAEEPLVGPTTSHDLPSAAESNVPIELEKRQTREEDMVTEHPSYDAFDELLPLLILPTRLNPGEVPHEWISESQIAPEWLSLFYDLSLVAVLGIFSGQHYIQNVSQIGTFASYFVIIYWVWLSQVFYDVRYQANDWWARFCKFIQLCAVTYIGASSGNWSLTFVEPVTNFMSPNAPEQAASFMSFQGVVIAYAASRGFLAVQYAVLVYLAQISSRPRRPVLLPLCTAIFSMILAAISAGLEASGNGQLRAAKIVLLYVGIIVEVVGDIGSYLFIRSYIRYPPERISERLACLSLIILGEGIIGILRAFNVSLQVFSQNDGPLNGQIFGCLIIIYITYIFSFAGFRKNTRLGRRRTIAWCLGQFPLHFCILLLLSALANAVTSGSYPTGTISIADTFLDGLLALPNSLPEQSNRTLTLQLGKLDLVIPFQERMLQLNASALAGDQGYSIEGIKYLSDITIQSAMAYSVIVNDQVQSLHAQLLDINSVGLNDLTLPLTLAESLQIMAEIVSELLTESVQGTLWLFPSAGAVLLLCSLGKVGRYERPGLWLCVEEGVQVLFAIALCFLAFLNTGGSQRLTFKFVESGGVIHLAIADDPAPIFTLVLEQWAIGVIAITFFGLLVIKVAILSFARRRRRGR